MYLRNAPSNLLKATKDERDLYRFQTLKSFLLSPISEKRDLGYHCTVTKCEVPGMSRAWDTEIKPLHIYHVLEVKRI